MANLYSLYETSVLAPDAYCSSCDEVEGARVRGIAFIRLGYSFDPESVSDWSRGIDDGDIIVIPQVRGTFDGGVPVTEEGFSIWRTTMLGLNYSLTYIDPSYALQRNLYNHLMWSRDFSVAFITETKLHLSRMPVTILPKNPVEDAVSGSVNWAVELQWSDTALPEIYEKPLQVFECAAIDVGEVPPEHDGIFVEAFVPSFV